MVVLIFTEQTNTRSKYLLPRMRIRKARVNVIGRDDKIYVPKAISTL